MKRFIRISRLIWAAIISLTLICSFSCPLQAVTDHGEVNLTATVALSISDVSASSIGYHGATISWKTNGDATSQVFYDTVSHDNTADYADQTEDIEPVSKHSVRLTGLSSGTTYHYKVRSDIPDTDFIATSEDYTFKTLTPAVGGAAPRRYYVDTSLFGVEEEFRTSLSGEVLKPIEATSEDGMLTLTIPEGTIALDKDGKRLKDLQGAVDESPPDPPEDAYIIGLAYDFGPEGATFDPGITFEYTYDPADLPEDVDEGDLVIAFYDDDANEWVELDCVVDTVNNTITADVEHFTTFAIIGAVTPPEEEEVVPPEEEEVVPPEEEEVVPPEEEEVVLPPEEEVVPPEEEITAEPLVNWPVLGGIIGGVVVVGLLVFFLVVRRRALKAKH